MLRAALIFFVFSSSFSLPARALVPAGSVVSVHAFLYELLYWWWWPIPHSLPPGYVAAYYATSPDGHMPLALITKADEWMNYWVEQQVALTQMQHNNDPRNTVWTLTSGPTCFEEFPTPGHNWDVHGIACNFAVSTLYLENGVGPAITGQLSFHTHFWADYSLPCTSGQVPNPTTGQCENPLPKVQCPIDPLPDPVIPLTDEEAWQFERAKGEIFDFENLSDAMQTGVSCMERYAPVLGGTPKRESGYRPPAYQRHLREVWDKNAEIGEKFPALSEAEKTECEPLRAAVANEMSMHLIKYQPATNSCHEQKPACAFDMSIWMSTNILVDARIDLAAYVCGLKRFSPAKDPTHFQGR